MDHTLDLLLASIVVQLVGAAVALASVRTRERISGWLLLSLTFVLMAGRRIVTLLGRLSPSGALAGERSQIEDLVTLCTSLVLIGGVVLMRSSLRHWRRHTERAEGLASAAAASEAKLREHSEFLDSLLSSLTHPFYVVNAADYAITLANPASRLAAEGGASTCYALTHGRQAPCEQAQKACPLAIVRGTKAPVTVEHIHTLPDGSQRHVDVHGYPILDDRGEVVQMIEYNLDVTERKVAERALRESEERYRSLFEQSPIGIYRTSVDGRILLANGALVEKLGYDSLDDLRSLDVTAGYAPGFSRQGFIDAVEREGEVRGFRSAWLTKSGSVLDFRENARAVRDANGVTTYYEGTAEDVTQEGRIQRALQESEHRFRTMADTAPVLIWLADTSAGCTFFNRPWLEFTGRTMEEQLGDGWAESVHPDDLAPCVAGYRAAFGARKPFVLEYRLRRADGEYRWVLDNGVPRFQDDGTFAGYIGSCMDITDRKRAEEKASRLAAIVESSDDAIIGVSLDGIVTDWNRGAESVYGWSEDEIVGRSVSVMLAPGQEQQMPWLLSRIRSGEHVEHFEKRSLRKDGREIEVSLTVSPVYGEGGVVVSAAAIARDITERQRAEAKANMLAAIVRSSDDAIIGKTLDGTITSWNRGAQELYGYAENEAIGKPITILAVPGNEGEMKSILERITQGNHLDHYESVRRRRDGRAVQVSLTVSPVVDDSGKVIAASTVARDITDRKRREAINASRLHLVEYSLTHSMDELLEETLNEAERLTGSLVGFFHFVGADQQSLTLQSFSTRTRAEFCRAEGRGRHYALADAGVWADCVRERRLTVHNDYASLPRRRGLPEGHAVMVRELVAPVFRGEAVSAVLGVGNKATDYTDEDIETISFIADLAWEIVERKRAEEAFQQSEEHLRRVYENSPLAYQSLDAEGRLVDANPAWCEMTGYRRDEVVGRPIADFLTPPSVELLRQRFPAFKAKGEVRGLEFEMVHKDGTRFEIEVNGKTGREPDGTFRQTYCILHDITERKQLEKEMRRSAAAMEQAAEAIIITDTDGVIQYVNPAFTRVTGYSREEALGQNPRFLKSGRHDAAFYADLWSILLRGETWVGRLWNKKKDGSAYEEEASIAPVRDESGRVAYYVAVKRDVTREVELQERLNRAQKMEALGSFASGIAHDFNNLIMVIQGTTERMLRLMGPGDPLRGELNTILRSARNGGELTRGLLSFSRRQILQPEVVRLDELVQGVVPMLRRIIPEHCDVLFDTAPGAGCVRVDRNHLEHVLLNLCVNGRDAMPSGGTLTIGVANSELDDAYVASHPWATAGSWVALTVGDTGTGMDKETLSHIFEPFFTTKEAGRGTGLGLATVYGIVKQHGGLIDVVSEPGIGTTFTIFLPRVEAPGSPEPASWEEPLLHGRGERILFVEDEPELRRLLVKTLTDLEYQVSEAADGTGALALMAESEKPFDLIVTDLVMPIMGGLDLYHRVRETHLHLPVLISSGYGEVGHSNTLPADRNLGFLAKPYDIAALARAVSSLLARARGEA